MIPKPKNTTQTNRRVADSVKAPVDAMDHQIQVNDSRSWDTKEKWPNEEEHTYDDSNTSYDYNTKFMPPSCKKSELNCGNFVVLFATFMNTVLGLGIVSSVGVFHVIFLEEFKGANGLISIISALNTALAYFIAPFSGALSKKIGCRIPAMIGGVVGSLGLVLSMFATTIPHILFSFGVLTALGLGLSYVPGMTLTGMRFPKYGTIAMSVAGTGIGVGPFVYPPMIRSLLETYGWRGAFLVLGGVSLNMCVMGALLTPQKIKTDHNQNKLSKLNKLNMGVFETIKTAFTNRGFVFLCVQSFPCFAGYAAIMVHLSAFSQEELGLDFGQAAMLFSYMGLANVIGRVLVGFVAQHRSVSTVVIYGSLLSIAGILTMMCGAIKIYHFYVFYAICFGILTSANGLVPAVVLDTIDPECFSVGYGCVMAFEGAGLLLGPPVAGWVFDATGVYPASLYLSGATMTFSSLALIVSMVFFAGSRTKKRTQEEVVIKLEQEYLKGEPLTDNFSRA